MVRSLAVWALNQSSWKADLVWFNSCDLYAQKGSRTSLRSKCPGLWKRILGQALAAWQRKLLTCLCPTSFLYKMELMISIFSPLSRDKQAVINVGVSHPTSPPGNSEDCVAPKNFPQHAAIIKVSKFHHWGCKWGNHLVALLAGAVPQLGRCGRMFHTGIMGGGMKHWDSCFGPRICWDLWVSPGNTFQA